MKFDYDIYLSDDIITIHKHDENYFDIILDEFWIWIKKNEMNFFCNDFYDPSKADGHGQESGILSKDQYFDQHYDTIKADLEKYLLMPKFKKYL
jgi:hypothetical protein